MTDFGVLRRDAQGRLFVAPGYTRAGAVAAVAGQASGGWCPAAVAVIHREVGPWLTEDGTEALAAEGQR